MVGRAITIRGALLKRCDMNLCTNEYNNKANKLGAIAIAISKLDE